jgi:hypothetical protein
MGQDVVDLTQIRPAILRRVTLGLSSANGFHAEPETNRSSRALF